VTYSLVNTLLSNLPSYLKPQALTLIYQHQQLNKTS